MRTLVQWRAWLAHKRDAPTSEEMEQDQQRLQNLANILEDNARKTASIGTSTIETDNKQKIIAVEKSKQVVSPWKPYDTNKEYQPNTWQPNK